LKSRNVAREDVEIVNCTDDDPCFALALRDSVLKDYAETSLNYHARAEYNERMIIGDQLISLGADGTISDAQLGDNTATTSRNLMRNLALTWTARVLEDRPDVKAYPATPGIDVNRAEVANRLLRYIHQHHDFDELCFRAGMLVQPHSVVGFKTVWDPLGGPWSPATPRVDEAGNIVLDETGQPVTDPPQRLGDVRLETCSLFDYGTDGSEEIEDSEYCWFRNFITQPEARMMYRAQDIDDEPATRPYRTIWGAERQGVEVFELWWRKGARFPNGLFIQIVGDVVIQARDFPYEHGELPLSVWKCGPRRASPFGSTHVDDAVKVQIEINEVVTARRRQVREIASVKFVAPSQIIDDIMASNQMIKCDNPDQMAAIRYITPPDIAAPLMTSLDDNTNTIFQLWGLSEMLAGGEVGKSTAAKAIAYLTKLDADKRSGTARSLGKAITRVFRQALRLLQQYVQAPRLVQIVGDESEASVVEFIGADLDGVDVMLEPAAGFERFSATRAQAAQDQQMQGSQDPGLPELAQTGLSTTTEDAAAQRSVEAQVMAAMKGVPVEADPEVDAATAIQVLLPFAQHPAVAPLLQQYRQKQQQQQTQQNQAQQLSQAPGQVMGGQQ